jgi:hypothetical protein
MCGPCGSVGCTGTRVGYWWGELKVSNYLQVQGIEGRIILKCKLRKSDAEVIVTQSRK